MTASPDGTLVLRGLQIYRVADGKRVAVLGQKLDRKMDCGGGDFLGNDVVLGQALECHSGLSVPKQGYHQLFDARTGRAIASAPGGRAPGNRGCGVLWLGDDDWAFGVCHRGKLGGKVVRENVKTGERVESIDVVDGVATLHEGNTDTPVPDLPRCR